MTKKKYVAVTTVNVQDGWREVARGSDRAQVTETAEKRICGNQWNEVKDIYVDTQLKNLRVVSATKAKRVFKISDED